MSGLLTWLAPILAAIWLVVEAVRIAWHDRPRPGLPLAMAGLALAVRLLVLPADGIAGCVGHEALYCDLFLGVRDLAPGDTTLYPAMQGFWWLLGRPLPASPIWLVWISALISAAGVGFVSASLGRLIGPAAAALGGLILAVHPAHVAWGTSAYNVALPWTLMALCLWAAVRVREGDRAWAGLGGAAFALAVACRMEVAFAGLLPLGLLVGVPGEVAARPLLAREVGSRVALALALGAAAVLPLAQDLPGEGERLLALRINLGWLGPYHPLDAGLPLAALLIAAPIALFALRAPALVALLVTLALHWIYAGFDDWGERHALASLPALVLLLTAGLAGARGVRWWAAAPGLVVVIACGRGLVDLRERYYASEEVFSERVVEARWADLPRVRVEAPVSDSPVDARCAWVSEEPRLAVEPHLSHFNLLDPAEAERLRAPGGCIHWCAGPEDWSWTSRGVSDRAARLARLYALAPVAVVEEPISGYACVVFAVNERRCCR